jgi:predicted GNAT family acetyltransferase
LEEEQTPSTKVDTADVSPESMTFARVDPNTWADFETLFESPGAPKYCWCMTWRASADERRHSDSRSRKSFMKRRVMDGVPVGILGYLEGKPVAWCSIGPRATYRPLGGIEAGEKETQNVWSLVCFYVPRRMRGRGFARRMLSTAVEHAGREGADVVEAYPVDPDSPSYRFMGFVDMFSDQGFREVGRAGKRRHVMRLELVPRRDEPA